MNRTQQARVLTPTLLTQLRAFEAVAQRGSFAAAAAELYVSPSAISHHISRLERSLGTTLLNRQRDRTCVSTEGSDLADACRAAFAGIGGALSRLDASRETAERVTVTIAPYFSAHWLTPRLATFWRHHPEVSLQLHHAYEPVDFATDNADLGIVWGDGHWANATAHKILDGALIAVCNPAVRSTLGDPIDVAALTDRYLLMYEFDPGHWRRWLDQIGVAPSPRTRLTKLDDSHALRAAAMNGHGIALFARSLLDEELAHGSLIQLATHHVGDDHYYLVTPTTRTSTAAATRFTNWVLDESTRAEFTDDPAVLRTPNTTHTGVAEPRTAVCDDYRSVATSFQDDTRSH